MNQISALTVLTSYANSFKPIARGLFTSFHGSEDAIIRTRTSLRWQASHLQQHMENIGKMLSLFSIVRRATVQWPLKAGLVKVCKYSGKA